VILVRTAATATELVRLYRAGLFDTVDAEAGASPWREVLARAGRQLDERRATATLRAHREATQQLLQDRRRRLRHESAAETAALLDAQSELEDANQRLADHMAQVSLLYRFGRELSQASNWDDTLREILVHLADFVGAAGAALVLRSAPGGPYAPRQTYRWQEASWDKVLLRITRQIDASVAGSLLAPGVVPVGRRDDPGDGGRITALPLEHQGARLGILLLLFASAEERQDRTESLLPFLQMVQMVLSEEVASAQMLDRLRDISDFNTSVLQTVSSAIWVCDGGGRTVFVNRAARDLLGVRTPAGGRRGQRTVNVGRGRLLERPLTGGEETDDLPEIFLDGRLELPDRRAPLAPALLRRKRPLRAEGQITDVTGHVVPVQVRTAPMAGRGQDDRWLLVILEDLREARRAEAARRRAEQAEALVAMSATLAHEIRNPLMGLSAQAELLADSLPQQDSRRQRLDVITEEVERINRTITDMLQFVRPCSPRCEPLDLARLLASAVEMARPRARERDVALAAPTQVDVSLEADDDLLRRVILNLVLNAVDAAPSGGQVRLGVAECPDLAVSDPARGTARSVPGVEIRVEDDGPGFGDRDPEELFAPFFTTKTTGTGLGLAYSRKVVDAHGGQIRAERDATAGSTRMCVRLPRQAMAGKQLAGEAS
jgi:signal transduction histidine kinase